MHAGLEFMATKKDMTAALALATHSLPGLVAYSLAN
jgi:hypothetical protein